jgi:hypothetical protein
VAARPEPPDAPEPPEPSDEPPEPDEADDPTKTADKAGQARLLRGPRNGAWLHEQRFPPLRYAVPGLIPEGMTLLVGPPKAGKSWAALDIALAVASGGRALGSVVVGAPRPVLYLALEDGDRRLQQRCRVLLAEDEPIPEYLDYLTRIEPGTALSTIGAWLEVEERSDPLVLLDTLGKVMPPASAGQGAYGHEYRVASALKRITDDHPGSSLVVLHHDRKAGAEDFVDAVSGTHGIAGAADTIVVLARPRGESNGVLRVTGRDVREAEYAVDLSKGSWVIAGGNLTAAATTAASRRATANLGDRAVDVFAEVSKHPDGITPANVAAAVGIDPAQVRVYLGRLVDRGSITRQGRGRYTPIPTTPVATVTSVTPPDGDQGEVTEATEATGGIEAIRPTEEQLALLADQLGARPAEGDRQ